MSHNINVLEDRLEQAREDLAAGEICQADYDLIENQLDQARAYTPGYGE